MLETALRLVALVCVVLAVSGALLATESPPVPCRTGIGACAQPGLPPCGGRLGPWRVTRARDPRGAPLRANAACVLAAHGAGDGTPVRSAPGQVVVVPQPSGMSGDTLVSQRPAARRERQRATVTLSSRVALPDHWAFAVAGRFLDRDATPACPALRISPPVNAGYAVIGANWLARPHGFYFERLADACVFDGRDARCPGPAPFMPHELVAGEELLLDLALRRADGGWWLEARVALREAPPADPAGADRSGADAADAALRELGRMRLEVTPPCWLRSAESGSALLIVIPDHSRPVAPDARVEVSDFRWLE